MELKKRLAGEIVSQLYDTRAAAKAEEHFAKVVQRKELPEKIENGTKSGGTLKDYLVKNGFAASIAEAKRLIKQGAVQTDGKRNTDPNWKVVSGTIIRAGKKGSHIKST
jgi:tyrosyl-tRNA synthetase